MRWTRGTLLAECLRRLRSDSLAHIRRKPLKDERAALYSLGDGRVSIVIDDLCANPVEAVLHELLHEVLDESLGAFINLSERSTKHKKSLRETIVSAIEDRLFRDIGGNPR